jgi:hypothetical protein
MQKRDVTPPPPAKRAPEARREGPPPPPPPEAELFHHALSIGWISPALSSHWAHISPVQGGFFTNRKLARIGESSPLNNLQQIKGVYCVASVASAQNP